MGLFQWLYDWFKGVKTPKWLKELTEYLTINILYPALMNIGLEAKALLERLIKDASIKDGWSNEKKFKYVVDGFKTHWGGQQIQDHVLNLCIELLVAMLKRQKII